MEIHISGIFVGAHRPKCGAADSFLVDCNNLGELLLPELKFMASLTGFAALLCVMHAQVCACKVAHARLAESMVEAMATGVPSLLGQITG